jgi:hypothetical protein
MGSFWERMFLLEGPRELDVRLGAQERNMAYYIEYIYRSSACSRHTICC